MNSLSIETVRLNERDRDRLNRVKRYTGITQWNILCRWAFCYSLAEITKPVGIDTQETHAMDIKWNIFSGKNSEIYLALIKERCTQDNVEITKENVNKQFHLHLQRGIGYLSENENLKYLSKNGFRNSKGLFDLLNEE